LLQVMSRVTSRVSCGHTSRIPSTVSNVVFCDTVPTRTARTGRSSALGVVYLSTTSRLSYVTQKDRR
jgi:hypothetical protein